MLSILVGSVWLAAVVLWLRRMPEARQLLEQWQLVVPMLVGWLGAWLPATAGVAVPVAMLVGIVVMAWVAAWVTPMFVRVARGEQAADLLLPCLRQAPSHLLRVGGALAIMITVSILPIFVTLVLPFELAMSSVLIALIIAGPIWNVLTATVLFDILESRQPLPEAMLAAMRSGWARAAERLHILMVPALACGMVVVLPGRFSVNLAWLGGYGTFNKWFDAAWQGDPHWLATPFHLILPPVMIVWLAAIKLQLLGEQQRASAVAEPA